VFVVGDPVPDDAGLRVGTLEITRLVPRADRPPQDKQRIDVPLYLLGTG
jgi:hypothetical protein